MRHVKLSIEIDTTREAPRALCRKYGDSWGDESSEQLVQDLDGIGVQLDSTRRSPKAPLGPLADETRRQRFFELMERARKALAG